MLFTSICFSLKHELRSKQITSIVFSFVVIIERFVDVRGKEVSLFSNEITPLKHDDKACNKL